MTIAFEHLRLKIQGIQEEMDEQQAVLDEHIQELQSRCQHSRTIHGGDIDGIRVCEICGAWELGIYNQFMDKIPPGREESTRGEASSIRSALGRHSKVFGRIERD